MKLEKLTGIIPDPELQRSLWGPSYEKDRADATHGKEMSQKELVVNLFSSEGREANILQVITILTHPVAYKGTCRKMLRKIAQYSACSGSQHGLSEEYIHDAVALCKGGASGPSRKRSAEKPLFKDCPTKKQAIQPQGHGDTKEKKPEPVQCSTTSTESPPSYDSFPGERCSFDDLGLKAQQLSANTHEGQQLIDEIKRRVKIDPAITGLSRTDARSSDIASRHNAPYDMYRAGRQIPGAFFNGSDVHTDLQQFLLFGCPRGPQDTGDFFDTALRQNVHAIVSLNQRGEPKSRYHNFWDNERLSTLHLRDGWQIQKVDERVLEEEGGSSQTGRVRVPKIVESTLVASHGDQRRELKHLQYDGWRDRQPMPSESLLERLYERLESLSPDADRPIAINCKGGVGRTGTVAVGYYLRRYIDRSLAEGRDREVNIPQIIYEFRKRRSGIIGQPTQLAQVYSLASKYYHRKTQGAGTT